MTEHTDTEDLFAPPVATQDAEPHPETVRAGLDLRASATFGQQLRAAREARGQTLADCGRDLHLPIKVLQRLEADTVGSPADFVFLCGALKGYAKYLGLPSAACDAALRAAAPDTQPQLVSVARTSNARWLLQRYGTAATYIILTATIAVPLVLLGLRGGLHRPATQIVSLDHAAVAPVAPASGKPAVIAPRVSAPALLPDAAPFRASIAPFNAIALDDGAAPATAVGAAAPATSAAGPHTLTVSATADCWYEIAAADGNKIDSGMLHAGDARTWHAQGALHVTLGNAGGVTVTSDGQPVALSNIQRSNVARFDAFASTDTRSND